MLRLQTSQKKNNPENKPVDKPKTIEKKLKKQQKFPFLKNIAQETYALKLQKFGLPDKKIIKYKAVNQNTLTHFT